MTDNKQPDALRLAGLLELAPEDGVEPQTTEDAAAELRRLHAENESLRGRSVPVSEADMVLAAMETGEWELQRLLPQTCFTSEANTRHAWSVKRSAAPYCTKDGLRIWTGATPLEALRKGAAALGVELPGCSETAALPEPAGAILGEQAELRRLSDCCPELNLSNYGHDDVDELNGWAIEVSQCIDRALAAQPAGAQQPAPSAAVAAEADAVVLEAALRAIHQAIDLIGEPDTERLRTVRRVLRGAVVVAEDSTAPQADSQPAQANTRQIAECYGDCPTDPKTCANPCKFEGRASRAPADSVLEDADRAMRAAQPAGAQQPGSAYAALMQAASDWICEHVPTGTRGSTAWATKLQDAARALRASHGQAPAQAAPASRITLDFKQATELLYMFGGEPGEITVAYGDGHTGHGLYAYYSDMPEEGSTYFGDSSDTAWPEEAPAAVAGEVVACGNCGGSGGYSESATPQPTQPQAGAVPLTDREIELIDGMIQVQLDHASRCDAIANRSMADKQKGWDMERVALLQKFKAHGIKGGQQ